MRLMAIFLVALNSIPAAFGGCRLRYLVYRHLFANSPKRFNLGSGVIVTGAKQITIGADTSVMEHCKLIAHESRGLVIGGRCSFNYNVIIGAADGGQIEIGDDVLVGPNVVFRASDHRYEDAETTIRSQGHTGGRIVVEEDVWIGANAVILRDVKIGHGSVVAAGAVVTSDIPPMEVWGGVPARFLKKR